MFPIVHSLAVSMACSKCFRSNKEPNMPAIVFVRNTVFVDDCSLIKSTPIHSSLIVDPCSTCESFNSSLNSDGTKNA